MPVRAERSPLASRSDAVSIAFTGCRNIRSETSHASIITTAATADPVYAALDPDDLVITINEQTLYLPVVMHP